MAQTSPSRVTFLSFALFAVQPLAFGAWLAQIPTVKAALGLDKAELALSLLGLPVATIFALQLASRLIGHFGPRRVLAAMFPFYSAAACLPLLAVGQWSLFAALMAFGFAMSFLQVGLNVYAGRVERATGLIIMNRCHGFWALGLMAGSFCASLIPGLGPLFAVMVIALPSAIAGTAISLALPHYGALPGQGVPRRRALRELPRALLMISIVVFAVATTEGAMADWAAVYLTEVTGAEAARAGIGVSVFAACLATGRFLGDALRSRLGIVGLARTALTLALAGLALLTVADGFATAITGFGLVGLGVSVGYPLGVSAVAALDDVYEGPNIALMSLISFAGFLIGPPTIGFLAEAINLRVGLAVLIPLLVTGWALAGWLADGIPADSDESKSTKV